MLSDEVRELLGTILALIAGQMRFRKLRIAWSVTWGIACVLLIVLWVRSYWWGKRNCIPIVRSNCPSQLIAKRRDTSDCSIDPQRL